MKKISLSLGVLLSCSSTISHAYPFSRPMDFTVPCYDGGFILGGSALYLHPSLPQLDYALTYPSITFPPDASTPATVFSDGTYHNADPEYDLGYEVFIGYELPYSGNDIKLAYRHINSDDRDSVVAPAILNSVLPLTFFNGGDSTSFPGAFTGKASGRARFEYNLFDFELGQRIQAGCKADFRFFAGIRYAILEYHFIVDFETTQNGVFLSDPFSSAGIVTVDQKSRFHGYGPLFGVDMNYHFSRHFSLVGSAATAIMAGDQSAFYGLHNLFNSTDSDNPFLNLPNTDDTSTFNISETRIVPSAEIRLGLGYNLRFCNCSRTKLRLEAGWYGIHFWNSVDQLTGDAFTAPENRGRNTLGTSYNGPYLTIQIVL